MAAAAGTAKFTKWTDAQRRLVIAIGLCCLFMAVEIAAGIYSHSLAILTDAAHMLSDLCSFVVSLFAIYVSSLPGTSTMSFGYYRAEILGALISILSIWILTIWLLAQATTRIIYPQDVKAPIMVYTAIFGIVTNIALASILSHTHHHHSGHDHSHHHDTRESSQTQNEPTSPQAIDSFAVSDEDLHSEPPGCAAEHYRATASLFRMSDRKTYEPTTQATTVDVYLPLDSHAGTHPQHQHRNINVSAACVHALGDLVQNIGVLIAGLLILWKPQWKVADPICTLVFSVVVVLTTIGILRDVGM